MRVQIYGSTTEREVRALVGAGVDHFGFVVGQQGFPEERVPVDRTDSLFDAVPADGAVAVLSLHDSVERTVDLAAATDPDILHVGADTTEIDLNDLRAIRAAVGEEVDLMRTVPVDGGAVTIETARRVASVADWLLLDTRGESGVGATGETHDWGTSARVADAVDVPVVLAGGLGPDNVAEAIRTVEPAGVDSNTRTSTEDGSKDIEAVGQFVESARRVGEATQREGE